MKPKFYVSNRNLMVEVGRESEAVIVASFMQNESKDKAADYLRTVADKLNKVYGEDRDKAYAILEETKQRIRDAQLAETCAEEVTFV